MTGVAFLQAALEGRVRPGGWMALMTTEAEMEKLKSAAGVEFSWSSVVPQPGGDGQLIALGARAVSLTA